MITDPIFYRLFETSPETLFLLLGLPADAANEMPELANAPLGLSVLYLIRRGEGQAPSMARDLVARAKIEITDAALRADLIELIETVIIYKLPQLSREEIQTMLQVHDIRETRV